MPTENSVFVKITRLANYLITCVSWEFLSRPNFPCNKSLEKVRHLAEGVICHHQTSYKKRCHIRPWAYTSAFGNCATIHKYWRIDGHVKYTQNTQEESKGVRGKFHLIDSRCFFFLLFRRVYSVANFFPICLLIG